jgi:hypothetical protein
MTGLNSRMVEGEHWPQSIFNKMGNFVAIKNNDGVPLPSRKCDYINQVMIEEHLRSSACH